MNDSPLSPNDPIRPFIIEAFRDLVGDAKAVVEGIRATDDRKTFTANVKKYWPKTTGLTCGRYKRLGRLSLTKEST